MSKNREIWLHEMEPASWMARKLTDLMAEFDEKFGDRSGRPVDYYLDGRVVLMHSDEPSGVLFPNDVEEWSYRPLDHEEDPYK